MEKIIHSGRLMAALSLCLDFSRRGLDRHHHRVAFTALNLAAAMDLPEEDKTLVFAAAIVHDAGVANWREKEGLAAFEVDNPWDHCRRGHALIGQVEFLTPVAEVVLSHHDRWAGPNPSGLAGREIPLAARIIHLADRLDVLLHPGVHVLNQREDIVRQIDRLAGRVFDPDLVDVFKDAARRESFWLDLTSPFMTCMLQAITASSRLEIGQAALKELAGLFAAVIDAKSPFTYRHSRRVAGVAVTLAGALSFGAAEQNQMEVAGLLHDLGKLSVPDEILEKPAPLTAEEYNVIRQHTYYTYRILEETGDLDPIPDWAAYHHEKLNGRGYPFGLNGAQLDTGARIVAVSDIFTALREDRPYRPGLKRPEVERIITGAVAEGALDGKVVTALLDHYDRIEGLWADL